MDVRRLWVDIRNLSRRRWLAAFTLATMGILPAADAWGHAHEASKVRFVEHSQAVFDAAQRDRKPVFLLVSAVWCYWCKYFEDQVLADPEVSDYLNRHYVNVFADHDRRPDVVRKYVRGLPMIVLFGPNARVQQSFAGVLKKEDFLGVVKEVATRPPTTPTPRPEAAPSPAPLTADTYQRLRQDMLRFIAEHLDMVYGGVGKGGKYPQPRLLAGLLGPYRAPGGRRPLLPGAKGPSGDLGGLL